MVPVTNIPDEIESTEAAVRAAYDEVSLAVMFHETWKPAAYDDDLHARMGNSYATHAFQVIRASLRREMLLSLMRVWDTNTQAVRMSKLVDNLRDDAFFDALSRKRLDDLRDFPEGMKSTFLVHFSSQRKEIIALGMNYQEGGSGFTVFKKVRGLRHQRLAHRQVKVATESAMDADDEDIEAFYADSLAIIKRLFSLVLGTSIDLEDLGGIYRHHAQFFWENARGERTEGHPRYRTP